MNARARWLASFGVLALCIICGLLGLTAGINLNPGSTVRFVPNWGSLADWVAGIGALAAVTATAYFGWRQREDLLPRLVVRIRSGLTHLDGMYNTLLTVVLANPGHVPIEVQGVFISSEHSDKYFDITSCLHESLSSNIGFPFVVGGGKEVAINFHWAALIELKRFVAEDCGGNDSNLILTIKGSVRDFSVPLDSDFARMNAKPYA